MNFFRTIRIITIAWTLSLIAPDCDAQTRLTWEEITQIIYDGEETSTQDELDDIQEAYNNPININTASEETLCLFPFLTKNQARDIIFHRETNGGFSSLGELMMISSLDKRTRTLLSCLCHTGETAKRQMPLSQLIRKGRHEVLLNGTMPFYLRNGDKDYPDSTLAMSPNKVYIGNRTHNSMLYRFSASDRFSAGIQMERDAGETGVDYLSAHAAIHRTGAVKTLIVGDYKASFGLGLTMNTGYSFGKNTAADNIGKADKGFTTHKSFAESNFLRGLASTITSGNMVFSTYVSYRHTDATLSADKTSITSMKNDGLHRTMLEKSKKGIVGTLEYGGNVGWEGKRTRLSATLAVTHIDIPLKPRHDTRSTLYKTYDAEGKDFAAASLSYTLRLQHLVFQGESGTSLAGSLGTLNSMQWNPNSLNRITVIQRYYGYRLVTIRGNCFGENSKPQNESGVFTEWLTTTIPNVRLTTHLDVFYFPWLKHQVSGSSYGYEGEMKALFSGVRKTDLEVRLRMKSKQKDLTTPSKGGEATTLASHTKSDIRAQATFRPNDRLSVKSTLSLNISSFGGETDKGFCVSATTKWSNVSDKVRLSAFAAYFDTDSYDTRTYCYEPTTTYSNGLSSFFDNGLRIVLMATYAPSKRLTCKIRVSHTKYMDKQSIGSGNDLVAASHKEDVQVQIRWRF